MRKLNHLIPSQRVASLKTVDEFTHLLQVAVSHFELSPLADRTLSEDQLRLNPHHASAKFDL